METNEFLRRLVEASGVSGFEQPVAELIRDTFIDVVDDIRTDTMGNVIARKIGEKPDTIRVMLAGHMDEIGLMVTKIDDRGFLKFTQVGGIDQRTLVSQEVVVHGKRNLTGVIGMKPPHLLTPEEQKTALKMQDMVIDLGLSVEEVKDLVRIGDVATIKRDFIAMGKDYAAAKAFDDRAAVAVMYECLKELGNIRHDSDIYAVSTVQEEVGLRGAITSTYSVCPHIGIAIDVCHGEMPGVPEQDTAPMGKGPNLAFGANIHPKVYEKLVAVARDRNIPYTVDPTPGPTGTDAWAMQVTQAGVPTAVVSIPLRYMHTSVETLSLSDIKAAGRLLAFFIASLDSEFVEGLLCY